MIVWELKMNAGEKQLIVWELKIDVTFSLINKLFRNKKFLALQPEEWEQNVTFLFNAKTVHK